VIARSGRSSRSRHADVTLPRVHWELCRAGLVVQARGGVTVVVAVAS
jgi:hypothetical protein